MSLLEVALCSWEQQAHGLSLLVRLLCHMFAGWDSIFFGLSYVWLKIIRDTGHLGHSGHRRVLVVLMLWRWDCYVTWIMTCCLYSFNASVIRWVCVLWQLFKAFKVCCFACFGSKALWFYHIFFVRDTMVNNMFFCTCNMILPMFILALCYYHPTCNIRLYEGGNQVPRCMKVYIFVFKSFRHFTS